VTAGVYILLRYCHCDSSCLLLVGRFTLLIARVSACVERDIKKVIALRTLSQLGVIIVSLGALQKSFCFFHLMSHAFFKALLFICIGTFIHFVFGTQDYRRHNLFNLPSIFTATSILSLRGFTFLSGFYRKDIIIEGFMIEESQS